MPRTEEELARYMQHWDEQARRAVCERLGDRFQPDRLAHFTDGEAALLRAMLGRMIPQPEGEEVDLAGFLDFALGRPEAGAGREGLPAEELIRAGLTGVEETSLVRYGRGFLALSGEEQESVLAAVQEGAVAEEMWQRVPAPRFFTELMTQALAGYCAHPFACVRLGLPGAGRAADYRWTEWRGLPRRFPA